MRIPLLSFNKILIAPLQEEMKDQDILQFQGELLQLAYGPKILGVILDITALDTVDSFMARVINETVTMLKCLGKQAVVTGMRPAVAVTLLEMGREFLVVETALNLEQGFEKLSNTLKRLEYDE